MKRLTTIGSVAILALVTACGTAKKDSNDKSEAAATEETAPTSQEVPADYGYIVKIGDKAPLFSTEIAYGGSGTITPSDFKGKVVMLQFTASWCSVCRKEMPHIESQIWQKYKDNKDFMLLGIDKKETADVIQKFSKETGITYPIVLDPEAAIYETFAEKKSGITRNVIIGKDGKIVFMTRLYKEEEFNEMISVIDRLLKE